MMDLIWYIFCSFFGHSRSFESGASQCPICHARRCPTCRKTFWRLNPKVPPDSNACSPTCYHKEIQELP